ncbi:MAG: glycosyltransferase family 4 protein [Deltaproteobacteria bacterium]|nr:MAG: glycosyltransferase family 4 protein [Deltaproteobacteria bacterium]
MHIGLLFYSETIALASQPHTINGRSVANNAFLKNLVSHKGSHHLTIFTASRLEADFLEDFLKDLHEVNIVPFIELENFFKEQTLDILHIPGPDLYRALHLRNAFGKNFAITGLTHSLGHQPFLEWLLLAREQNPQFCDRLICTSPTAQNVCQGLIRHVGGFDFLQTHFIPLGIDTTSFDQGKSLRKELHIDENAVVFLSLGRFSYITKTDLMPLLLMFSKMLRTLNNKTHLILAGATGTEDDSTLLEEQSRRLGIQEFVTIITNPDEEKKINLYKTSDVFLALNDNPQETFGLSILEASASGMPVIASAWNGYRSLICDSTDGFLIPTTVLKSHTAADIIAPVQIDSLNHFYFSQGTATDMDLFYEKAALLVNNPILRMEMGLAAQKKAASYDWKNIIQKYFSLWGKLGKAEPRKSDYPVLDYHAAFASYGTQVLSDDILFKTNPEGLKVLDSKQIFQYFLSSEILDLNQLLTLLNVLQTPQNLKTLSHHIKNMSSEQVAYHLLWLYKYGFLSHA